MSKIHYAPEYFKDPAHPITVTVVGVGGNGTQVLTDLAKMHSTLTQIGHAGLVVTAYDDDIVDTPNVGRQKFSPQDIGQPKVNVLITRLNRFYGLNWKAQPHKFNHTAKATNLIISAVDNVATRIVIKEWFSGTNGYHDNKKMYWLDFGNGKDFGQFVLGSTHIDQGENVDAIPTLPNVMQLFPNMAENEEISEPSCSTVEALMKQDLFINSVLVSTGMNLIWRLLHELQIDMQGGYVNLAKCSTKPIKL